MFHAGTRRSNDRLESGSDAGPPVDRTRTDAGVGSPDPPPVHRPPAAVSTTTAARHVVGSSATARLALRLPTIGRQFVVVVVGCRCGARSSRSLLVVDFIVVDQSDIIRAASRWCQRPRLGADLHGRRVSAAARHIRRRRRRTSTVIDRYDDEHSASGECRRRRLDRSR